MKQDCVIDDLLKKSKAFFDEGKAVNSGFLKASLVGFFAIYAEINDLEKPTEDDGALFQKFLYNKGIDISWEAVLQILKDYQSQKLLKRSKNVREDCEQLMSLIAKYKKALNRLRKARDEMFAQIGITASNYRRQD